MAKITFFGGAGEIGGNKFLLEDGGAKVYLDFGQSFDFGEDYFFEWLQPRNVNGLECYFEFGMVPEVERLYSEKMLRFTGMEYKKPDADGVFITHHHSDHTGHLTFLDENIPVHMGHGTYRILDTYRKLYPQFTSLGDNKLELFKSGDEIPVKDLVFKPTHVEHSTPGAYGYVIEAPEGNIVFTGDFRMHGPMRKMSEEFIKKAVKSKPKIMLCEGTRMTPDAQTQYTEQQVYEKVKGIIQDSKGLVFTEFSMCNIDRFQSIYKATVEEGRKLVIDTRYAYILENLADKIKLPDPLADENLKIYFRMCKSCKYREKDYYKHERPYLANKITQDEIQKNQKDYVMFTGFTKLMELVYIQPEKADYIYSSSEHFLEGEDNKKKRTVLENWLNHFGIKYHHAHCSGHASKKDLEDTIKKIKPDVLIPIHTQNPEEFKKIHENVMIPKEGDTLNIK
ncbi:MAG TPA: MBL fold metallo-hydrolase [Candidatus Altiarchaeales archaeon]|nr:MBL fold metallo-hydrolase [Candidatus Altiarchaeales archaeon]